MTECNNYLKKSLFVVGEIGQNGSNVLIVYKSIAKLHEIVPPIVEEITKATMTSIEERAVEIVVPGNFSIGCNFGVLTVVNNGNKDDYDQFGCLAAYNVFIKYYNQRLN
ncbi:GDSL esterase/lipase [Glycine soja]